MAVYLGYQLFRKLDGKVFGGEYRDPRIHGSLGTIRSSGQIVGILIEYNKKDNPGEQANTIVHELCHIGVEAPDLYRSLMLPHPPSFSSYEEYERYIQRMADDVCDCQPNFVKHIMDRFLRVD